MSVHVFGIRHHGPGSARSLVAALRQLQPDLVLVEGPVEGDSQIQWVSHEEFRPPVALLIYRPDEPLSSVFYPFARFSPEWNALVWAARHGVPARFLDLPKTNWMALGDEYAEMAPEGEDPLDTIARLAGEEDFERWWDRMVESKGEADVFPAIEEAMSALRSDSGRPARKVDLLREAAMRQQIRQAQKAGHARIAVVCGAWHAPALTSPKPVKEDAALLSGLPKVKVQATWVPWTHGRLMRDSGYGAGVESPGWYAHLWQHPDRTPARWVSKVARLLRKQDLDASPAQVVDTVRLAEALASFRGRREPGLSELNEATEAALLFGNAAPMRLVRERLIVGEVLGEVPAEATAAPIQRDLEALQKRLRLKPDAWPRTLDLDLRKEFDRERSQLLHRLEIIGVSWGKLAPVEGKSGTFHEIWELVWKPEFAIDLIAAARWGNTVETAASALARHASATANALPALTRLLEPVLKANLSDAAVALLARVRDIAAVAPDISDLMDAIPPLARVARYGDVRQTGQELAGQAIEEMFSRVCTGLATACASLDDDAARRMTDRIAQLHVAISVFDAAAFRTPWQEALRNVADLPRVHGQVGGRAARILFDAGWMEDSEAAARASQALSPGIEPGNGAAWIEGFLEHSGAILLANSKLWSVIDAFVQDLAPERFQDTLPLLRRTFAGFASAERRQLGERVRNGARPDSKAPGRNIDEARAALALPLLEAILGLEEPHAG